MKTENHLSILTLLLMISFASVNAVLFTPALPTIANYFNITNSTALLTITWFLVGYAIGQLLYGPLANRFGRKPALYAGIILQIISSIICIIAGPLHSYKLLVLGRFLLALGSGVGLKMTFTLINEVYAPAIASQKASYLMIAFAITPGLGVMLGGLLNTYFGWQSTFAAGAIYGVILLLMATHLPETKKILDLDALKLNHLIEGYTSQFKNITLLSGGMLMGSASCFVYVFAAFAPFIAIDMLHMTSAMYGIANLLPPIGLVLGSIYSAKLATRYPSATIIRLGVLIALIGSIMMLIFALLQLSALLLLFIPMIFCYFGLALVFANASTIALSSVTDKAHGSAVMNFVNMGFVTLVVLSLGLFPTEPLIMPCLFILLTIMMFGLNKLITQKRQSS